MEKYMNKSDFFYHLPHELIAQTPIEPRDHARLLKVNRKTGEITHSYFYSICDFLNKGDLLVLNDSKVFPARLLGVKRETGVPVEFLLLERKTYDVWEVMVRPGRRLKIGTVVDFSPLLSAQIIEHAQDGNRLVRFSFLGDFYSVLDEIGQMPLPPYITEKLKDKSRYNTIYSKTAGSSAAPTAGLHFTDRTFKDLKDKGIDTAFVTLHVGLGTFRPVKEEKIENHKMHSEQFTLSEETAEKINRCKQSGGRVIAVGTTSCRVLESVAKDNKVNPTQGNTDIFIYPGYQFQIIDGLLTNFHLPESTLIMLVSAFLGREKTLAVYEEAIRERYRFFSFGDATLIL